MEQAAGVLLSKAKDAMAGAQRAAGMESDRPEMSAGTMGAAGKVGAGGMGSRGAARRAPARKQTSVQPQAV